MSVEAIDPDVLNTFITAGTHELCPADSRVIQTVLPMAVKAVETFLGWTLVQRTCDELYYSKREPQRSVFGLDIGTGATGRYGQTWQYTLPASSTMLTLRNRPVRSITNIWDNPGAYTQGATPTWPNDTKLAAGTYYLDTTEGTICQSGIVHRPGGWFQTNPRTVRVQYVAGFTAAEIRDNYSNIQFGLLLTVAAFVSKVKHAAGIARAKGDQAGRLPTSISVEDFAVSFGGNLTQFGMATGGNTGGAGAGIPDEAVAYLSPYMSMSKYLPD